MATPSRVAVLASGGGTNLQSLLDRFNGGPPAVARVELVVASRAGAGALDRAHRAGVDTLVLDSREIEPAELGARMVHALEAHRIDLVVLAGYLQLVPAEVVSGYHGRMINIHPALLPAFGGAGMYGMRVHRAVLEAGVRVSGATVHFVDERYDEGAIVAQWPVPVLHGDTPESLAARVLRVEHVLLPAAVEALATAAPPPAGPADAEAAFALDAAPAPDAADVRHLIRLT